MPESYLITGGNGLLGSHIARQLLERGETAVAVFDIAPAAYPDPRVSEFLGDITNREDIMRAVRDVSLKIDSLHTCHHFYAFWWRMRARTEALEPTCHSGGTPLKPWLAMPPIQCC